MSEYEMDEFELNECVFCGCLADHDNSIPSFWVDDTEYCGHEQCVCHTCVNEYLFFDTDDEVYFLPNTQPIPARANVFLPN